MSDNERDRYGKEIRYRQKYLDRLKTVRLLDDDFFTVCFQNDTECTELVLKIILGKDDLNVIEAKTQETVANLLGHSVRLDVLATDSHGTRYNGSLIDAQLLLPREEYSILPECYVIFITENDVFKKGLPIYHIDRTIRETGEAFDDGSHIIYANTAVADDSPLGRLMQDFICPEPSSMHYEILANKTKHFKHEDEGGQLYV